MLQGEKEATVIKIMYFMILGSAIHMVLWNKCLFSHKNPMLNPSPWCISIWRWGLWEVIRLDEVGRVEPS